MMGWRAHPGLAALGLVLSVAAAESADGGTFPVDVSGEFGLEFIYDDNIVRYSDDYLDYFVHGVDPYKFEVETYDDLIVHPRLDLLLDSRLLSRRAMEIRLRWNGWTYSRNGIKDNNDYSVRIRQPLSERDLVEFNAYHSPMSYIRQLSDRDPFESFESNQLEWKRFGYVSNSFGLDYSRKISGRWEGEIGVGRAIRFYNQAFMENDNWEWNYRGELAFRPHRKIKLAAEYTYHDVEARGTDSVGETIENSDDSDASYERDSYELAFNYFPRRSLWKISWIQLKGGYAVYYFTSDKPLYRDPYHVGRKDAVYRIELTVETYRLNGPFSLEAGYRYTQRTTDSPWEGDIAEDKDYTNNRVSTGLIYSF